MQTPAYLAEEESLFRRDPRAAAIQWFKEAGFGLFMHYGIYSILGRGEWVQLREAIPLAEYRRLKDRFTAERFDADFITDLAMDAGMRYVNITSRHHDSFCLFRTGQTDYSSVESPAKRDLVQELADACRSKRLGLFLYYSYALDWAHPWFPSRESGIRNARPDYAEPEPSYLWRKDEDTEKYIEFVHSQLGELLTQYGPIAGIWLDPIAPYYDRPDLFPVDETYALIRSLQPQCLISFKQGANGDEDFVAPEHEVAIHRIKNDVARRAWDMNRGKPAEICTTLQPRFWGHNREDDGKHRRPDDVMKMLSSAREQNANLLLNTGPLADGSIPREDVDTLREVGRRLRSP
ncbi:MAG: alpha-L-fucosidase [Armatimonadota bacterium]